LTYSVQLTKFTIERKVPGERGRAQTTKIRSRQTKTNPGENAKLAATPVHDSRDFSPKCKKCIPLASYLQVNSHYEQMFLKYILSSLVESGPDSLDFASILTGAQGRDRAARTEPHYRMSLMIFKLSASCAAQQGRPTLTFVMEHRALSIAQYKPQRRSAVRYKLHLPVIFHWSDGVEHTEGGFTCDVALDGTLICSTKCPDVGAEVQIEVLLPSPDRSGEELRIQCVGKVTRVSVKEGSVYFGVEGGFDDEHFTSHQQVITSGNSRR
jgi:hypothetical protein